jgi:hypothetical protein
LSAAPTGWSLRPADRESADLVPGRLAFWRPDTAIPAFGGTPLAASRPCSGQEPLTCRLQEVWPDAAGPLAAQIAREFAQQALAVPVILAWPCHEPCHAGGRSGR